MATKTLIKFKKGRWCVTKDGKLRKFTSQEDAYEYAGLSMPGGFVEEKIDKETIENIESFSATEKIMEEIEQEEITKFEDVGDIDDFEDHEY